MLLAYTWSFTGMVIFNKHNKFHTNMMQDSTSWTYTFILLKTAGLTMLVYTVL